MVVESQNLHAPDSRRTFSPSGVELPATPVGTTLIGRASAGAFRQHGNKVILGGRQA